MNDNPPSTQSDWLRDDSLPRFRDLDQRRLVDERMDDPTIEPSVHFEALKGIQRINVISTAAASIWPVVRRLASAKPVRVLDLACGGGDVAIALARKARRLSVPITVEGCDISQNSVGYAQDMARRRHAEVRFFVHDALCAEMPTGYDAIYSSLFIHHLPTPQVLHLLASMAAAAPTVIINDLIRCRTGLFLSYAACHALSRSPVVHFDGPSSVAAAFTIPEIREIARDAGLANATVTWKWPFRYLLTHSNAIGS